MRLLINLATLKKGGGQNVALNFLESLRESGRLNNFIYGVAKGSDIHVFLTRNNVERMFFMPNNPLKRIIKEFFLGNYFIRKFEIDIIYTYFGVGLYSKKIPQVIGAADSNIFFPELDFWADYDGVRKIVKKIIDKYRIWGLKYAYAVILENEAMLNRGSKLFNLQNTIYIKPSVSRHQSQQRLFNKFVKGNIPVGLFLCSWQLNKNYMMIPKILSVLRSRKIDMHFVITAEKDNSKEHKQFEELASSLGVQDSIHIIGSVQKADIPALYSQIDIVFLLSKLESFSNNIIEAWNYRKALIISDEEWSKSICKNAACYVKRDDAEDIVDKISYLLEDTIVTENLLSKGDVVLSEYPSIVEKTMQEITYIKKMFSKYYEE